MVDQLDSGFPARHIGITDADRTHMLEALGLASLDELADRAVPANIRSSAPPELPARSRSRPRWTPCRAWLP